MGSLLAPKGEIKRFVWSGPTSPKAALRSCCPPAAQRQFQIFFCTSTVYTAPSSWQISFEMLEDQPRAQKPNNEKMQGKAMGPGRAQSPRPSPGLASPYVFSLWAAKLHSRCSPNSSDAGKFGRSGGQIINFHLTPMSDGGSDTQNQRYYRF